MKKIIKILVLAAICSISAQAWADQADLQYEKARACYSQLKSESDMADSPVNWKKCISSFQKVAEQYPESPKAPQSLYSAGRLSKEMYLKTNDLEDAKQAVHLYNLVVKNYPKNNLADDALYQIGVLRQNPLQQKDKAHNAFKALLNRYPNSDMAPKARQALADLGEVKESVSTPTTTAPEVEAENEVAETPPDPNDPFALSNLYRYDVDANDQVTVVTLYMNQQKPFTRKFEDFGLRTKSPGKLTLTFPRTKLSNNVNKEENVSSSHLNSIKLKHGFFSGDLVASFETPQNTDYNITQKGEKTVIKFYPTGTKPTEASAVSVKPTRQLRIVIDPGHGGEDEGAVGPNGVKEKDITLSISKKLAHILRKKIDAQVYLTRSTDRTLSLEERNQFANEKQADIFLSIHANAVKDRNIAGIETFYLNNASDEAAKRLAERENKAAAKPQDEVDQILLTLLQNYNTEQSRALAEAVHSNTLNQLKKNYSKIEDRKLRSALFYVLVGAKCPGILIETSYISNPLEEKRLNNTVYQRQLAEAVANGVKTYVEHNADLFANL
ncbi:MAG: N-acetylmuramoyl-L-alanine amidase [Pseudomonadota bacterium]